MSYSAVDDFSVVNNPNGVWTYSYSTNNGQILLNHPYTLAESPLSGLEYWWDSESPPDSAIVGRNVSGTTTSYQTIVDPVNFLALDPEGERSVDVIFTDPVAGTYNITGSFLGIDIDEASHDVEILVNGTVDFSGSIDAYGASQPFDLTESLTSGSTVEFAVDTGAGFQFLPTGLAATITSETLCFMRGTQIITNRGEVAVENLQAGDMVKTTSGHLPVRWIGESRVSTRFAEPLDVLPIRIRAGALGEGLPLRDLLLSPGHAIFIHGLLIQAGALVNGVTIIREANVPEIFSYYHVELATHELLLVAGVAAESFVDNVDRMNFTNWNARETPIAPITEMSYPRIKAARQLPRHLRNLLSGRMAA